MCTCRCNVHLIFHKHDGLKLILRTAPPSLFEEHTNTQFLFSCLLLSSPDFNKYLDQSAGSFKILFAAFVPFAHHLCFILLIPLPFAFINCNFKICLQLHTPLWANSGEKNCHCNFAENQVLFLSKGTEKLCRSKSIKGTFILY